MKGFISTSVFWLIVLLWWWIYMSNYQSDALYNFLNMSNPATEAVNNCYSWVNNMGSGLDTKLDLILNKLNITESNTTGSSTNLSWDTTTGTLNKIIYTTWSSNS